jgi:hypothetical protein
MKKWMVMVGLVILNFQLFAGLDVILMPVGGANQFPPKSESGDATLGLDTSKPSGESPLTIQGGVSQGIPDGTVIGEVFFGPPIPPLSIALILLPPAPTAKASTSHSSWIWVGASTLFIEVLLIPRH